MILAGTHSPEPSMPAISIADMPEFGNQMVGVLSPLHSVSIQNSGTDTLEIVSITILAVEDSPSTDFVIAPGNCEKSRIEKGASCQIGIGFSPKGVGLRQAKLVLKDNVAGSPHSFSVVGTGLLPPHADARANPPDVDFGTLAVEGRNDSAVAVLNEGNAPLNIEDIYFDGDAGPFAVSPQSCERATIQADNSCQLTVSFSPRQPGTYSASISIAHGDAYPLTVPIRGTASGPRHGFCCISGKIDKVDEATCAARGGTFSEDLEELRSRCQPPKRQLAAAVPIQPGTAFMKESENLYPCSSIPLMWKAVYDPGETISYTVSLDTYSSIRAQTGQDPWQSYRGFSPTIATQLTLSNLLVTANPKASVAAKAKTAMMMNTQSPQYFRWQVVANDSAGNVSPASDWRYFRCQVVIQ